MTHRILTIFGLLLAFLSTASGQRINPPKADHHQHLFSPPMAEFQKIKPITANDVITLLDAAGIEKAVLLSTAYSYGRPGREPQNEYEKVREENDWVGAQAALYPKRLIGFCSFNPLKDYALEELARCSKSPTMRRGIKMHLGNSDVQLEKPEHIAKLRAIFRAANENGMAIVVHMRASFSLQRPYGAEQARAFIEQLMPEAPDVTVQIAHLGSAGPGYDDPKVDAVMDVFADAIAKKDRRTKNIWFDVTTIAHPSNPPERTAKVAERIRQLGPERILYGTDAALKENLPPAESWKELLKLGLPQDVVKKIVKNRAPYFK